MAIAIEDACDFETFLDLAAAVDDAIDARGYRGAIQLATFHPDYRFGDAPAESSSHWTNRSPFPVLHLLREDDVERALEARDGDDVWRRNVDVVEEIGGDGMRARRDACFVEEAGGG